MFVLEASVLLWIFMLCIPEFSLDWCIRCGYDGMIGELGNWGIGEKDLEVVEDPDVSQRGFIISG